MKSRLFSQSPLVWVLIPLLLGILISAAIPRPVIGIIYLDDAIYSGTARSMIDQLMYARKDPIVRAVVLVFNTPGGTVSDTESVYREINILRQEKPVILVIESMAASGGYYLASATDYIFAKSSSMVGNIGVIGYMPPSPVIIEDVISTGPYKLWGYSRDNQLREVDMMKQGFWQVVQLGRGQALKGGPEQILTGRIWTGSEALKMGLVDEMGALSDGVNKAAQMARVQNYAVLDLSEKVSVPALQLEFFQTIDGVVSPYPQKAGLYMLYIPGSQEQQP